MVLGMLRWMLWGGDGGVKLLSRPVIQLSVLIGYPPLIDKQAGYFVHGWVCGFKDMCVSVCVCGTVRYILTM